MMTTTESVLFLTVWGLTGTGLFFGLRAKLRKRNRANQQGRTETGNHPGSAN